MSANQPTYKPLMDEPNQRLNTLAADVEIYYPFIDGLRGIAILMVVLCHLAPISPPDFPWDFLSIYFRGGCFGVTLFFLVSAFTLFSASLSRESKEKHPKINFYIRRFFRIMPLWILVNVGLMLWCKTFHWPTLLLTVVFYFGLLIQFAWHPQIGAGWSLCAEESFYIVLPWIMNYLKKPAWVVGAFFLTLAINYVWCNYGHPLLVAIIPIGSLKITAPFYSVRQLPPAWWFCFFIGIGAYHLYVKFNARRFFDSTNQWLLRGIDAVGILTVLTLLNLEDTYIGILKSALISGIVMFSAFFPKTGLGMMTRHPLLRLFGKYCYSIYLLHWLVIFDFGTPVHNVIFSLAQSLGVPSLVRMVMLYITNAFICLGVGHIAFHLVELPFVRLGKNIIRKLENKSKPLPLAT